MRLTVKFAHFNQRFARISQYKSSSERAYKSIEDHIGSLFSSHDTCEQVQENSRALSSLGRK